MSLPRTELDTITTLVASNNLEKIKEIISQKKSRSYFAQPGDCALREAIKAGHADIVDYLLEQGKGANVNGLINPYPVKPFLQHAAEHSQFNIIESLLKYGAMIQNTLHSEIEKDDAYVCIKNLLDYAMGYDVEFNNYLLNPPYGHGPLRRKNPSDVLNFLWMNSIAGLNFIGVSCYGQPITREMLSKFKGCEDAIVTIQDLDKISSPRRELLLKRLEKKMHEQGKLISSDGIVNLVPLWLAAKNGDIDAVKARLNAGVNPNESPDDKYKPIALAASGGHFAIVRMLAEHPGFDKKSSIDAIQSGKEKYPEIADYLTSLQDIDATDSERNTLLHHAVKKRDIVAVEKLLKQGANVNAKNNTDETPLLIAVSLNHFILGNKDNLLYQTHTDIVKLLLANGAGAYIYNFLLLQAIRNRNTDIVALLLPYADKREIPRQDRFSAKITGTNPWYVNLMFEAWGCPEHIEILKLLIAHGADLHKTKNDNGMSFLQYAVMKLPDLIQSNGWHFKPDELIDAICFLIDNNADFKSIGCDNRDLILHLLINARDFSKNPNENKIPFSCLTQRGININAKNSNGSTPLHLAIEKFDFTAVKELLEAGANPDLGNKNGFTAQQLANQLKKEGCMKQQQTRYPFFYRQHTFAGESSIDLILNLLSPKDQDEHQDKRRMIESTPNVF